MQRSSCPPSTDCSAGFFTGASRQGKSLPIAGWDGIREGMNPWGLPVEWHCGGMSLEQLLGAALPLVSLASFFAWSWVGVRQFGAALLRLPMANHPSRREWKPVVQDPGGLLGCWLGSCALPCQAAGGSSSLPSPAPGLSLPAQDGVRCA